MTGEKSDRRVERTRNLLREALLELIHEKSYDKITIQDIVDRANVGRTTFYAHFRDKSDLLIGELHHPVPRTFDGKDLVPSVTPMFEHAGENYRLYLSMRGTEGLDLALKAFRDRFESDCASRVAAASRGREDAVPPEIVGQFLGGAMFSLLVAWLEAGMPRTPAEMNEAFSRLARYGLSGLGLGGDRETESSA